MERRRHREGTMKVKSQYIVVCSKGGEFLLEMGRFKVLSKNHLFYSYNSSSGELANQMSSHKYGITSPGFSVEKISFWWHACSSKAVMTQFLFYLFQTNFCCFCSKKRKKSLHTCQDFSLQVCMQRGHLHVGFVTSSTGANIYS